MLRKVKSNAITVDPFITSKSGTPITNERLKSMRIKKNLVSDKTADTLTSSITTLFHPQVPEAKNLGITPSTVDKYFHKYFTPPYRRFSEKKNGNKKTSPLNENCKVSSDIESFRNSVQNIDNDQFSMSQSGTSNKDHKNHSKKMFCNSHLKLKSSNKFQQKQIESNQDQEIPNEELVDLNQEQEQQESLKNQDNFIYNHIQEQPNLIFSQKQQLIETSKLSNDYDQVQNLEVLDLQKFDSLETIEYYVTQFRVQIKKTIILNQIENQKLDIQQQQYNSEIKQYQNSEVQANIQEEKTQPNNYQQQQEQEQKDMMFNQAKSEILKPQQIELKLSTLNTKKRRFQIKLLFHVLIVILLIIFYTLIV